MNYRSSLEMLLYSGELNQNRVTHFEISYEKGFKLRHKYINFVLYRFFKRFTLKYFDLNESFRTNLTVLTAFKRTIFKI